VLVRDYHGRRQNAPLPAGVRWAYYATLASPLKAAVAFGVRDIRQLRQHVHSGWHGAIYDAAARAKGTTVPPPASKRTSVS
jgi:hypothetical protein